MAHQRTIDDVRVGDVLPPLEFPLSAYRLAMAAGANRDFNSIHHNNDYAQATGARAMYANFIFLQGMWERAVRDYIGLAGSIQAIRGFRMRSFNTVDEVVTVQGRVLEVRADEGTAVLEVWSATEAGVTVGPGTVEVTLPR